MTTATGLYTHFDLPGICTDGPHPVPGLHYYDAPTLNASDLLEMIDAAPGAASWCMHYGSTRLIYDGPEILEWLRSMTPDTPVYAEHLHPVAADTPQRPQDMWLLRIDARTGHASPDGLAEDPGASPWDCSHLTGGNGVPNPDHPLFGKARSAALEAVITRRDSRDLSDGRALAQAMPTTVAAALQYLESYGADSDRNSLVARTTEALDRAYGRAVIARAGVDLEQQPKPGTYGYFYRMGFPPPTHQEMALHIAQAHGKTPFRRAARILRKLLGLRSSRWTPLPAEASDLSMAPAA